MMKYFREHAGRIHADKRLPTCANRMPADLYQRVMESDEDIPKGEIFAEIVRRFGNPEQYERATMMPDKSRSELLSHPPLTTK